MERNIALATLALVGFAPILLAQSTHRLHDGVTLFVANDQGKDFMVHLGVRDLNLYEVGPREVLVKVYDPLGRAVVRQVLPDDGIPRRCRRGNIWAD
jgi:hypothetical protein